VIKKKQTLNIDKLLWISCISIMVAVVIWLSVIDRILVTAYEPEMNLYEGALMAVSLTGVLLHIILAYRLRDTSRKKYQ